MAQAFTAEKLVTLVEQHFVSGTLAFTINCKKPLKLQNKRQCQEIIQQSTVSLNPCPNWPDELHRIANKTTTKQTIELPSYSTVEHAGVAAASMCRCAYVKTACN